MTETYFDEDLNEIVEKRCSSIFGICPLCGEASHYPIKYGILIVCNDCYLSRNDDCRTLKKNLDKKFQ